jgi:hypothetical protein
MGIDKKTCELFVKKEAMEQDNPGTPLVCRFEDGSFHEVIGVIPTNTIDTPEGYQRIIARKIYRIAFPSMGENPEMYEKICDVKPPVHSGINEIKPAAEDKKKEKKNGTA